MAIVYPRGGRCEPAHLSLMDNDTSVMVPLTDGGSVKLRLKDGVLQ